MNEKTKETKITATPTGEGPYAYSRYRAKKEESEAKKLCDRMEEMHMNTFDNIIGYEEIKKNLRQIADTLKNRKAYEKVGATPPNGLLLHGEPGVGKTMMANAVIGESGLPFYLCRKTKSNGDFIDEIKANFDKAVENAPAIVYLDDMDKFANVDRRHRNAEEFVTVQSCIDEVKGKGVFVLATANDIECLPESLVRVGRFDRVMEVCAPRGDDARKIIEHYMKQKSFVGDLDYETVARIMDGQSCAALETVINEASLYAGFERSEVVTMDHFLKACMRIVFKIAYDPQEIDDENEDEDYSLAPAGAPLIRKIAYHEAAHVVAQEVLCPGSVTLSSICAGDGGQGGVTSYCRNAMDAGTRARCRALGALAGMAVSEQVFGECDMGCGRDLEAAFRTTRHLVGDVCANGLGFFSFGYDDSETRKARIEEATTAQVEQYYRTVKELLAQNREFLDKIAAALLAKKLITCADIKDIRESCTVVAVAV